MKVKLQPPSGSELPAYNPILPPSAITQVMLIANPAKVRQLRFLTLHRFKLLFHFFFNCTCFRFTICLGRGNLLILCGRCARQYAFDMTDEPLHLNISIHTILLTPPYTFLEMLTRRICLSINSFLEVKRLTMWPMQKAEYDGKMF